MDARSDSIRRWLLLIVQGLMWMDRRCFCFLLQRPGGSSRRFRFFVTVSAVGAVVLLTSGCAVRCFFVGRGEPSSVTHLCGTGSAGTAPAAAAVASVVASVPVACSVCLRRCFAGLGDGSSAIQR